MIHLPGPMTLSVDVELVGVQQVGRRELRNGRPLNMVGEALPLGRHRLAGQVVRQGLAVATCSLGAGVLAEVDHAALPVRLAQEHDVPAAGLVQDGLGDSELLGRHFWLLLHG